MKKLKKILVEPKANIIAAAVIAFVYIVGAFSLFTLKEGEQAAAFRWGEAKRNYTTAGLKVKYPWEEVIRADKRLLLHSGQEATLQEKDKKNLLIDYFAIWRIKEPTIYLTKVGSIAKATRRIDDNIGSDAPAILGENLFVDIVTNNREILLDSIKAMSNRGLDDIALDIELLSFNRVELPKENQAAVFNDMIADRSRISAAHRAQGTKLKDSIMTSADRRVREIVSAATMQADSIIGLADATKLEILNRAYARSKPLFEEFNKIETYKKAYSNNTEWIMKGDRILTLPK